MDAATKATYSKARSAAEPARQTRLRRDLRISLGDGAAFGGMVGLGETYLPAFVLAVGLGELTAGLVASAPLFAGGVMQMVSPWAVRWLHSHKRWVVLCAGVQALTFIPLFLAAVFGSISSAAALAIAATYWGAGLATGPAWNTWIGRLVPPPVRSRFFAVRTRTSQAAVFVGFLLGGLALQAGSAHGEVLTVFAALFALACICRLASTVFLALQSERPPSPASMRQIPLRQLLTHLHQARGGQLLVYLVVVQAAVQMAGPYFAPFMFRKLELSYGQFVALISAAFLAKIIALGLWGKVADRLGAWRLLWIGGIGIAPLSAGWIFSQNFYWLAALQIVGGATWAAYELAFFLLFFESIAEEERTSLLTLYNLFNTGAWVAGSLLGAVVLVATSASFHGYLIVFGASAAGRCLALLLLARIRLPDVMAGEINVRTVAVRPNSASLDAPVLPGLPDQMPEQVVEVAH